MKSKNILGILFLIIFIANCKDEQISELPPQNYQYYQIPIWAYSERHFFIDEIYADENLNLFNRYYNHPVSIIYPYYQIKKVEIWKSVTGIVNLETEIRANAFINLERRAKNGYVEEKQPEQMTIVGISEIGRRFVLLEEGKDYVINKAVGMISLEGIQDHEILCASYTIEGPSLNEEDDIQYGDFIADVDHTNNEVTILKMIKPPNLQPVFRTAWKLQLRNIYSLPMKNISEKNLELNIYAMIDGKYVDEIMVGDKKKKLISLFGLDKYDEDLIDNKPDGKFDFDPGRTIIPETGEIIFPILQPFGRNLPPDLPDSFGSYYVYDTSKYYAQNQKNKFFIGVKYYME